MSVFDAILEGIRQRGYHNHRLEAHSDLVSHRMIADLQAVCKTFAADCRSGTIRIWAISGSPHH